MIPRIQEQAIKDAIQSGKILMLTGPSGAGKSELINKILNDLHLTSYDFNCADKKLRKDLSIEYLLKISSDVIVLNEAQFIENIQDYIDACLEEKIHAKLVLTCSFLPSLNEELYEAMVESNLAFSFYPPSFYETANFVGLPEMDRLIEERLIYGNYSFAISNPETAEESLLELINSLFKTNLGSRDRINKEDKMMSLLRNLAFNIGVVITYHDLGSKVNLDNETVERYIDLLEKADILIRLKSFSTNQRYELKKTHCIYFIDNGIRNALIQNFNNVEYRNDMGSLWKNYLISERYKWLKMNRSSKQLGFWRTHTKQQIDFLEMEGNEIFACKLDWEKRKKVKIPASFSSYYPLAKAQVINRSSYWTFLSKKPNS